MFVQAYTLYSSVRPFGVSTILGAVDKEGPQLYVIEPSGIAYVCSRQYALRTLIYVNIGLPRGSNRQGSPVGQD